MCKNKQNCATCIHGFQLGWETYSIYNFTCNIDGFSQSAYYFRKYIKVCPNWLKRNVKNERKFKGAFYMNAGKSYMDRQWREIGRKYGWL